MMANIPIVEIESDDEIEYQRKTNFIKNSSSSAKDRYYYAKKSKHENIIAPWQLCELLGISLPNENGDTKKFLVKFSDKQKDVTEYELASAMTPLHSLTIGTRIIAKRRNDDLPYRLENGQQVLLFDNNDMDFYPGIIANYTDTQYMVFFDDGIVQLVKHADIRRVEGDHQWHYAHWNAKAYFEFYLKYSRWELSPLIGHVLKIELNGNSEERAKVLQIEGKLAKIHFEQANRFEWIYCGSPRIYDVFRKLMTLKRLDNLIHFKTYNACVTDLSDDVVLLDLPESEYMGTSSTKIVSTPSLGSRPAPHECSHQCVKQEDENDVNLDQYTAFQRPILTGWYRFGSNQQYYRTPCGRYLYSIKQIDDYLLKTNSKLRIDCFDLNKCEIPIMHDTLEDISRGVEKISISVRGHMSLKDKSFNYITDYRFKDIDVQPKNNLGRIGCNCTDNCRDKKKCSCWKLTIKRLMGRFPSTKDYKTYTRVDDENVKLVDLGYTGMKLMKILYNGIVECSSYCNCCRDKCVNRVVQNGLQHKLELFMTKNRGWGVKTISDIPAGAFVSIYAGDVLDIATADKRNTKYQFKLPKFKIDDGNFGDDNDDNDDSDVEPEPEPKRQRIEYDVVQPFLNFFPLHMTNGNANRFPEPEPYEKSTYKNDYVVDGMHHGNISRFVNHSCDPNLFVQSVYVGDDTRFPQMAFFAGEMIKGGTELTINYGYTLLEGNGSPCLCGSKKCRGRLT